MCNATCVGVGQVYREESGKYQGIIIVPAERSLRS